MTRKDKKSHYNWYDLFIEIIVQLVLEIIWASLRAVFRLAVRGISSLVHFISY
ncbi:UNVERIFIED_CONTAM: hypothetical protein ABID98_003456 [Brevibacillus sp. OAP136]